MNFIDELLHSNCYLVLYINYRTNDKNRELKVKLLMMMWLIDTIDFEHCLL
jgi:hypothetical protein